MWAIISLHISFMFYICRTRYFRKRAINFIIVSFALFVLSGFYGFRIGREGRHDTSSSRHRALPVKQVGLEFSADTGVDSHHVFNPVAANIEINANSNKQGQQHVDPNIKNNVKKRQETGKKIEQENVKNNYPGFNKPWKEFPDPIILQPQPVAAIHVDNALHNHGIKPPQQQPAPAVDKAAQQHPVVDRAAQQHPAVDVQENLRNSFTDNNMKNPENDRIHLAVVCCGDRSEETLVMLKSAILNTKQKVQFHIFAEEDLKSGFVEKLQSWPAAFQAKIQFTLHSIQFPPGENPQEWKKVFKTCATQRLFLPDILTHVDSLLYVDTDILFIRPLDSIWAFFKEFNATQFAALTPEHEIKNIGWYNRFARHPYYGMTGLNSGVMLMNLTRMRAFGWTETIVPIYREYKTKITWGDQDLINILFSIYPDRVFVYPCEWNFRPDHCMYSNNCHRLTDHGVSIIHGNRGVYHNEKQWPFRMIYEAFLNYELGTTTDMHLIQPLQQRMSEPNSMNMYCGKTLIQPVIATLRKYCT